MDVLVEQDARAFVCLDGTGWRRWPRAEGPAKKTRVFGYLCDTPSADSLLEVMSDVISEILLPPPPPNPECTNEILSPKDATVAAQTANHTRGIYNYDTYYHRDLLLLDRLNSAKIPYLDIRMLYSRSDAHVSSMKGRKPGDCIHLCSPGPLGVIGRLFHQLLLNEEWS